MTPAPSIIDAFADWVRDSIAASGLVPADRLFDDRDADLGQLITKKLAGGLGWAVGVGYCTLDESAEHDGANYNVEIAVAATRNITTDKTPVSGIMQALFLRLKGRSFDPSMPFPWRAYDTHTDHLRRTVSGGKETHTFTVSAAIILPDHQ